MSAAENLPPVIDMIDRACLWERSRTHGDQILVIGSSRVGVELNRAGSVKVVSPSSIKSDLLEGYKITGDVRLLHAASSLNLPLR